MIQITRSDDDSSQKLVSKFMRRVKKANLVARLRKTRYHKKKSVNGQKRVAKERAMRMMKWAEENKYVSTKY